MHRVIGERAFDDVEVSADRARELLADMLLAREFDERALALQRRGWMSGYPPFRGQEASQVAAAQAMADDDWLFPTYRSNAMQIARGVPLSDLFLFRRGYPEFVSGHEVPVFPQAIPIATQIPHAVGAGMANTYRDDDHASVAYFGDGATSEGDFHEGMNFAGVFDAPVLFFCENNGWAISMRADRQTAAPSIAAKAGAYGFEGRQVDGNDPLAVYEAMTECLETVRDGTPLLLESLTYRQGAHTTSDDPSRYRDESELPAWRTRDPIERTGEYLRDAEVIDDDFVAEQREGAAETVESAVETAEALSAEDPGPDELFEHVYAELPPRLREQRAAVRRRTSGGAATDGRGPAGNGS